MSLSAFEFAVMEKKSGGKTGGRGEMRHQRWKRKEKVTSPEPTYWGKLSTLGEEGGTDGISPFSGIFGTASSEVEKGFRGLKKGEKKGWGKASEGSQEGKEKAKKSGD